MRSAVLLLALLALVACNLGSGSDDARSLASLPVEIGMLTDALEAKWNELGVVRDGTNHEAKHRKILAMTSELEQECAKEFFALIEKEVQSANPDTEAMGILAARCKAIYATNDQAKKAWDARYPISPDRLAREHQARGTSPAPWYERLGVSREEYEHFTEPMDHLREVARQEIEIRRTRSGRGIRIDLVGKDLLLPHHELDLDDETATTPLDVSPLEGFVDLERASLPPGVHRGVPFRTPDEKIRASYRRESLVIGEVGALKLGIFHYSRCRLPRRYDRPRAGPPSRG